MFIIIFINKMGVLYYIVVQRHQQYIIYKDNLFSRSIQSTCIIIESQGLVNSFATALQALR